LVKLNEFFPGIVQFFLCRQKCHERTELQAAFHGQVAPNDKNKKRAQGRKKVVADLNTLGKQGPPNPDFQQFVDNTVILPVFDSEGAVALDFVNAGNRFGDFAG